MVYWVKMHWIVKKIFSKYIWDIPNNGKKVYLTFDDGPTPEVTEWVLSELKKHNAKATFFCIGDNIEKHPEIFRKVVAQEHSIGNHTFNHLNGWRTSTKAYIDNFLQCEIAIQSNIKDHKNFISQQSKIENQKSAIENLFRPPYGKIKPSQANAIKKMGYKIVMWDVLSADFDNTISQEKCLNNVLKNIQAGSVIIFHDSKKAFTNLEFVLPKVLQYLRDNKYVCEKM